VLTGSHLASIDAVRGGSADVASIDALSWAYQQRLDPDRLDGLVVVERGPLVPCLPLIVGGEADDALVAAWRSAFSAAMSNPSLARARSLLLIEGFVPLDLADYQSALATLAGAAAVHSDTRTLGRTKET
jgi:ABC-type phosphate/phosphonate transport system substrate-binding protein